MPEKASRKTQVFELKSQKKNPAPPSQEDEGQKNFKKTEIRGNLPFDTSMDIIHVSTGVRRSHLFGTWRNPGVRREKYK